MGITREGSFTVADVTKAGRGTDVILHLRSDEEEFLDDWRLRSVVSKYSDHISVPVEMFKEGTPDREEDGETIVGTLGVGAGQPRHCALDPQPEGHQGRGVSGVLQARRPRLRKIRCCGVTTGWKGRRSTPACSTSRLCAPFDLYNREQKHGLKLYGAARLHHGRRQAVSLPTYLRFVKGCWTPTICCSTSAVKSCKDNKVTPPCARPAPNACSPCSTSCLKRMAKYTPS